MSNLIKVNFADRASKLNYTGKNEVLQFATPAERAIAEAVRKADVSIAAYIEQSKKRLKNPKKGI